ncbi:MAG: signal peptide peptidase SppA [Desulfurivibrionaceae bacterium]|nr:signal peptide peptidase SppA [Desulfobulbales bacterium]MDT8334215.1 signal peptide peptidase SppA [Desulfurivibrionaceae bacterium]
MMGVVILAGVFAVSWFGMTFFFKFLGSPEFAAFGVGSGKIGVVEIRGIIASPEEAIKQLTSFRENRNIAAIVLRIESPGGAVGASQEIFEEVKRTSRAKPVVASMGSIAASGGYYAALGANRIVASPGTLTGSIGVIIKFANFAEIFKKIGYKSEVIKSGLMKNIGSPGRSMTEAERELIQAIIDNVHGQFVTAVSEGRDLPEEKVRELADGRIFSGEQALQAGLIDQFGNFNDAVELAANLAGLKEKLPDLVYPPGKDFSLLKLLVGDRGGAVFEDAVLFHPVLSYEWNVSRLLD